MELVKHIKQVDAQLSRVTAKERADEHRDASEKAIIKGWYLRDDQGGGKLA